MGDLTVRCYEDGGALPLCDDTLTVTCHAVEMRDLTETWHAVEMGDLTETCHAVEMGNLTVECYEDGGALPLGDVARNEKVILDK